MPRSTNISLSPKQIIIAAIIGAILWFCAAMLMRAVVKMDFYEGMGVAIVYALTIPGTIPFVILLRKLAGLGQDQIAIGYTVATAVALMLDGSAFAFFPALYADNPADGLQAPAAILWGAGVGLVLAIIMNRAEPVSASGQSHLDY